MTKSDGTANANTDVITLTNNDLLHLFSNIRYKLSGQVIQSLFYPGQGTTMLGLLKYADDGKITLDKIFWFLSHVFPADIERLQLYKSIESNPDYQLQDVTV